MMNVTNRLIIAVLAGTTLLFSACKKEDPTIDAAATAAVQATTNPNCGAIAFTNEDMRSRMMVMEKKIQAFLYKHQGIVSSQSIVTIPVVFHVVYNTAEQNISDAQIQSQVDALNADFSASNADISNVPPAFQSLIGNAQLQFVLAKRDPGGNAATGITRNYSSVTSFSSNGAVCYTNSGGCDAWPASQYLNIWICNKSGAAGYSSYPWSGNASTDGVIIGYNFIGTTGTFTNNWNYQKGRTLTHEIGHWLGLIHIWGDATCGDDLVGDTPSQSSANGSCPVFPHMSACSPNTDGDMYMNYMDYTNDDCRNMFSVAQAARMNAYLTNSRPGILTSMGAIAPGSGSACNAPSATNINNITSNTAMISWNAMGSPGYTVQYKVSSTGVWSSLTSQLNYTTLTDLLPSTQYDFQVQSNCVGGSSVYTAVSSFTTLAAVVVCNIPAGLFATSIGTGSATFNWLSTGANNYNVRYKDVNSAIWATITTANTALNVTGLAPSTSYEFQVQSLCSSGASGYSASSGFTTAVAASACMIPGSVSAGAIGMYGATISWTTTVAVQYKIQYRLQGSLVWNVATSTSSQVVLSGLQSNSIYECEVQSICSTGATSFSTPIVFQTLKRRFRHI
jgi:hypothetical protein